MARKPIHLVASGPKPRGRQVVWDAIRTLRCFTARELARSIDHNASAVSDYLSCLRAGGIIAIADTAVVGARRTHTYELVRDVGIEAPRLRADGTPCTQGLATEQMWRTMAMLADFSPRDLAVAASTEQQPVAEEHAGDYVGNLLRAGYLTIVQPSTPVRQARYRLVKRTGPKPPMVQRLKSIWDPNIGQIMWQEEPGE
jgi:hypothetical protein